MSSSSNSEQVIHTVEGISLATASAKLYPKLSRDDLVLIKLPVGASVSALFTKNNFQAAPVLIARQHLAKKTPQYLLINAANANAGTGEQGFEAARRCLEAVASITDCDVTETLPFSTGVIGEDLPVEKILHKIPDLCASLSPDNYLAAAKAIMTTDTVHKVVSKQLTISGKVVNITGIAKGSGMIQPNMATMLAYIFTDADIQQADLELLHQQATAQSFNRISVDGDMSTNDACVLAATGKSNCVIKQQNAADYEFFQQALNSVFIELAKKIVLDGEGATKFITIEIEQGNTLQECEAIAFKIANSPLVKTAFFASDANWGRILAAIGATDIQDLDVNKVAIWIDDLCIVEGGVRSEGYSESRATDIMQQDEITIQVRLNRGNHSTTVWTSDLSHEYIRINAEYRT